MAADALKLHRVVQLGGAREPHVRVHAPLAVAPHVSGGLPADVAAAWRAGAVVKAPPLLTSGQRSAQEANDGRALVATVVLTGLTWAEAGPPEGGLPRVSLQQVVLARLDDLMSVRKYPVGRSSVKAVGRAKYGRPSRSGAVQKKRVRSKVGHDGPGTQT